MNTNKKPKAAIVIGSDSESPVVEGCVEVLKQFGVEAEVCTIPTHPTPCKAEQFAKDAKANGIDVIIGAAGKAADLPGVLAASTVLPVIGLPIKSSPADGVDPLLSVVQTPKGVPLAAVAINGSNNAGLLAVQILSLAYKDLRVKLKDFKTEMARQVEVKDAFVKEEGVKLCKS